MAVQPAYVINGNSLPAPKDHKWIEPDAKGDNGNGQRLYTPYFSYELSWDKLTQTEFQGLLTIWLGGYLSGTYNAVLPQYNGGSYGFITYSGTVLDRPMSGGYYENYVNNVKLTIRKINVGIA